MGGSADLSLVATVGDSVFIASIVIAFLIVVNIFDAPLPVDDSLNKITKAVSKGHTVLVGQTQYGKTTAAMWIFTSDFLSGKDACYIFVDTKHDDAVLPFGSIARNLNDLKAHLLLKTKRIIYRPPGDDGKKEALTDLINTLFSLKGDKPPLRGHKKRKFAVFIDEVQLYAGNQGKHSGLQRLSTTGLGKHIYMFAIGQRIQDINKQVYSQCNNTIMFFMRERNDYLNNQGLGAYTNVKEWLRTNKYYFAYIFAGDDVMRLHSPLPLPEKTGIANLISKKLGGFNLEP